MISQLHLQNFKSWRDTGPMRFAPLTGFFGTNSSGKTSILQFLVMMKQTAESNDQARVLHTGDKNSYIDLGTFYDLIHNHQVPGQLEFVIDWELNLPTRKVVFEAINDLNQPLKLEIIIQKLRFEATIQGDENKVQVEHFVYHFEEYSLGMRRKSDEEGYDLVIENIPPSTIVPHSTPLTNPIKSYDFPSPIGDRFFFLGGTFERLMKDISYLGPLREYPSRIYPWSGERPQDVGTRGEWAIPALLASPPEVKQQVARWLKTLGLIHSFDLRPIAENRREYETVVKLSPQSAEVPITDVGFGISQILPVLVLCYYVPEKSIIILEQPEIHLHPAVQANLADVFVEVIKTRGVQIILESHSEHLLRRLQRRIAEEQLQPEETALYFTSINEGVSNLAELDIDTFGNIRNWPENFFGDELGDLEAMTEAAIQRRLNGGQA
jgi:hypothetical protein